MLLIGYGRVSTYEQDLTQQIRELEAVGCEEVYSEKASGKNITGRKARGDFLKCVRKEDVVVETKLDRIAHSLPDLLAIVDQIEAGIKSLAKAVIDTTSAAGCMVNQFLGVASEFERNRILEPTMEGLAKAKLDGKVFGRPKSLSAAQILQLKSLRAGGSSYLELTETFGMLKTSIYRYCRDNTSARYK